MKRLILLISLFPLSKSALHAQTPTDAVMMKQLETCFALTYDRGDFDQYWEGTYLRKNGTIETVTRWAVQPMIATGIHDKLNLIIAVPYVRTESSEPNGGKLAGAKGFQDLSLVLKGEIINKQIWIGKIAALASAGYSTPITNYLSDYRPYSIGFGANEFSLRGIVQYKLDLGVYVRGSFGHLWRGQTKVERDYYYADGSYYTPWMDVPSAFTYNAVAGVRLLKNSLVLEANYTALNSTSGDDIRKYNAAQPTNEVDAAQAGFMSQYYFKHPKGLGVLAYYYSTTSGRNVGKVSGFGAGLTYQFKI